MLARTLSQTSQVKPPSQTKLERAAVWLFGARGIDGTSMRDIAEQAGMSLGAVYRYHKSKEALARSLMVDVHGRLAAMIAEVAAHNLPLDAAVTDIIDGYLNIADGDWPLFRVYIINFHRFDDLTTEAGGSPAQMAARLIAQSGEIPPGGPPPIVRASMALGVVMQVALAKSYGQAEGELSQWRESFHKAVMGVLHV